MNKSASETRRSTASALRRHWPLLVALALIAPLFLVWSCTDQMGEFANDGPGYLMMARHFAHPGQHDVIAQAAAQSRLPPLYPLLLAWSGSAGQLRSVHAVTTAAFLLALAAYYFWLRGEGLPALPGALAVLLCTALRQSWLLGLTVQSEYLYLLLSLLSLRLMQQRPGGARGLQACAPALAVCAAALTRTIGLSLLLPLLLSLRGAPWRRRAADCGLVVVPLALWQLTHRSKLSYESQLLQVYGVAPLAHLVGQVRRELPVLQEAFLANFGAPPVLHPALLALGAASLAAAVWRAAHGRPDAAYLFAYLAIVLLWPFPEETARFVWAILPMLLAQPVLVLASGPAASHGTAVTKTAAAAGAALMALALIPGLVRGVERYAAPGVLPQAHAWVPWYQPDLAAAQQGVVAEIEQVQDLRAIQAKVPAEDCVLAVRPDLINFYAERRAAQVPLNSVPDPEFQRRLYASGCRFVFMQSSTNPSYPVPLHPAARLGDAVELVYYNAVANPPGSTNFAISALARFK